MLSGNKFLFYFISEIGVASSEDTWWCPYSFGRHLILRTVWGCCTDRSKGQVDGTLPDSTYWRKPQGHQKLPVYRRRHRNHYSPSWVSHPRDWESDAASGLAFRNKRLAAWGHILDQTQSEAVSMGLQRGLHFPLASSGRLLPTLPTELSEVVHKT